MKLEFLVLNLLLFPLGSRGLHNVVSQKILPPSQASVNRVATFKTLLNTKHFQNLLQIMFIFFQDSLARTDQSVSSNHSIDHFRPLLSHKFCHYFLST